MLTQVEKRAILVRAKARGFAKSVKGTNLAFKLPEELIDWLKDEEIVPFKAYLNCFGLVQRKDSLWEENR